jgi:hypothetical protein
MLKALFMVARVKEVIVDIREQAWCSLSALNLATDEVAFQSLSCRVIPKAYAGGSRPLDWWRLL